MADAIVIAPASADFIARLTVGMANDLLSTICLATSAPILLAPAMNQQMYRQAITQQNLTDLSARGIHFVGQIAVFRLVVMWVQAECQNPLKSLNRFNHFLLFNKI